jgi:hypothetical protein
MIRPVLTEIGIFLIPFALYAAYLVVSRAALFDSASWPGRVVGKLTLGALILTIISLVLLAHFSGASPGSTYVPAHLENGVLVPGTDK